MRAYVASVVPIFALALAAPAHAAGPQWSTTELQLQLGELDTPQFAGGGDQWTFIITGQHASGWSFGTSFFAAVLKGGASDETNFDQSDV